MPAALEPPSIAAETAEAETFRAAADLLGGRRILHHALNSKLDAHEMILHGLPSEVLHHLAKNFTVLPNRDWLEKAIGISTRTYQRHKDAPARPLSQEQSGRAWKFVEIIARATKLFGSRQEAELWLIRPAIGLDQRCPIDLLTTPAGTEIVEEFLERLEYGVYT